MIFSVSFSVRLCVLDIDFEIGMCGVVGSVVLEIVVILICACLIIPRCKFSACGVCACVCVYGLVSKF